jgi:predicted nucleotide-binding protein with TIR-like domain
MKPKVFIGSSSESEGIAYALQENLDKHAEITVWSQGIFEISQSNLDSLIDALDNSDFGIFVLGADDIVNLRGEEFQVARDNVIFELGLFAGRLGKERICIVMPNDQKGFRVPTDLLGLTPATFDPHRTDDNINAAVGPACNKISKAIKKFGLKHQERETAAVGEVHPSVLTPDSPLLNQLINSAIQMVCRAVSLPHSPEASKIRVFIFRKEENQLVCSHYWAPNPVKEMVGKLRFDITPEVAQRVAVVKAVIDEEITRTKITPLPDAMEKAAGEVSEELSFVLAAPIFKKDGSIWGTVDFDASTKAAEIFLSTEVSNAAMFQLAQHLKIIFSLHA